MIKGFSCICTLSDRRPGWSIWHLSGDPDGPHIFPVHKKEEAQFQELSAYAVIEDRHFVGWCTELDYKAGALDGEYSIGHSGTRRALGGHLLQGKQLRRGLRYRYDEIYIVDNKDNSRRNGHQTYIQDLQWLHSKTVILWDMSSERGRLVNGTSALLHLVLASIEKDESGPFSSTYCFDRLSIRKLGKRAEDLAAKILSDEQNLNLVISKHGEGKTLLRERIEDLLYILRSMIEQQILALSATNRSIVELEGWDFMDIANVSIDPFFPRSTTLARNCRGWMQLLQDTCAITLYGRNFGNIIQSKDSDQCTFWRNLPPSKSYLAASVYDLAQIMEIQGDPYADPKRLSANTLWPILSKTFKSCDCGGNSSNEHSDMAQILVPIPFFQDQFRSMDFHSDFPESGAVIFERVEGIGQHNKSHSSKVLLDDSSSTSLSEFDQVRDSGFGDGFSHPGMLDSFGLGCEEYLVAIICALPKELLAVRLLFDKRYPDIPVDTNDTNHYALGHISGHDIVAACLPSGVYGNNSAATVASNLRRSFPNICICLLVGIGGGVPSGRYDVRLGDVVVSHPVGSLTGVVKYDFGKLEADNVFERTGTLQPPPQRLLTAISKLRSEPDSTAQSLQSYLNEIMTCKPEYAYPGSHLDTLYIADYAHVEPNSSCASCNGPTVQRACRNSNLPNIHYGIVASGDQVMKNAQVRDRIGNKYGALCFEMEAAGITNVMPCLAIRGICDYSDSHKQEVWQEYACASAAACAKLLLSHVRAFKAKGVHT